MEPEVASGEAGNASLEDSFDPIEAEAEVEESEDQQESEAESPPAEDTEDNPDDHGDDRNSFGKRIGKLTDKVKAFQSEAEKLSQELRERDQKIAELQAAQTKQPDEELRSLQDFDYDESKYQAYMSEQRDLWTQRQKIELQKEIRAEFEREQRMTQHAKREAEFKQTVDDFDITVAGLQLPQPVLDDLYDSDVGPDMAYYYGNNPEEAQKLFQMSAHQAIRTTAALEAQIKAAKEKAGKKSVSKAPPPPNTKVRGSEPGLRVATNDPKSDKMSDDEWFKAEEARLLKQRAG
jgi:hypothetical protein